MTDAATIPVQVYGPFVEADRRTLLEFVPGEPVPDDARPVLCCSCRLVAGWNATDRQTHELEAVDRYCVGCITAVPRYRRTAAGYGDTPEGYARDGGTILDAVRAGSNPTYVHDGDQDDEDTDNPCLCQNCGNDEFRFTFIERRYLYVSSDQQEDGVIYYEEGGANWDGSEDHTWECTNCGAYPGDFFEHV